MTRAMHPYALGLALLTGAAMAQQPTPFTGQCLPRLVIHRLNSPTTFAGQQLPRYVASPFARPLLRAVARIVGPGCRGTGGIAPQLRASDAPRIGNSNFAYHLQNTRPMAPVTLVFTLASDNLQVGQCVLWIQPSSVIAQLTTVTDPSGAKVIPQPIPPNPSLEGLTLFAQGVVLDPEGALFGAGALTDGLMLRIGY